MDAGLSEEDLKEVCTASRQGRVLMSMEQVTCYLKLQTRFCWMVVTHDRQPMPDYVDHPIEMLEVHPLVFSLACDHGRE